MLPKRLAVLATLAALMTAGTTDIAAAQAADAPQATEEAPAPDQEMQAEQPEAMPHDMMRPGRMGFHGRMMGERGHMMKMMFAIADADGNGALSFEEVSTLHRRIFDAIDADNNGEVTQEEVQTFMRP